MTIAFISIRHKHTNTTLNLWTHYNYFLQYCELMASIPFHLFDRDLVDI
jgi:hypothetical protein